MKPEPIEFNNCPKKWTIDLDKAFSPAETIKNMTERLDKSGIDVIAGNRRIDIGRLGIPVYMSMCGKDARAIMPTRKQMGKGSSPEQAQASALMEVVERFSFFSFWQNPDNFKRSTWSVAENLFGDSLIPISQILLSVHDSLDEAAAREILDTVEWTFAPATRLNDGKVLWLPLDWFRMLGEFNGSSAGNTPVESVLQGLSEVIERHVSALASANTPVLPTILPDDTDDPVLTRLIEAFQNAGVSLILKDMSLGMPLPTVAAIAWDPLTAPVKSEVVFTAGTATSPAKAAIRAITEVAQLGGDFCTGSCYEASGLPKYESIADCLWILDGPETSLASLPDCEAEDMRDELMKVVSLLEPLQVYAVDMTHPGLGAPAHWCIVPGAEFRERDRNQSLGLFTGKKLAEECDPETAEKGLKIIAKWQPDAHYLPFFRAMLELRRGNFANASGLFSKAAEIQPDDDTRALALFYAGYALTQDQAWAEALPFLQKAWGLAPGMKEAVNLLGVAHYKLKEFALAEEYFSCALSLDKGSAMDLANRGVCRKLQGKFSQAREDLKAALELDPSLDFARQHLSAIEME